MQQPTEVQARRPAIPKIFYGWYIVAAGMGIHLWLSIAWIYGMQLFFSPIVQTFGWSRALVSGAFSLQRLEGSIVTPIEGFLVDRFGPRKMVMTGVVIIGLGFLFLSQIQEIWMFYGGVLIVSLGMSASMNIPRTWTIVQWFRRLRGRALGIGFSGAALSGPLLFIVVWLIESFGWRNTYVILGISTWVICFPLALLYRSRPRDLGLQPDGDPAPSDGEQDASGSDAHGHGRAGEGGMGVKEALRTPAFWVLTTVYGAQSMGVSGLNVHLVPYYESIGFTAAEAASAIALFTVLSLTGRLGGGWAMDVFPRRYVLVGFVVCQALSLFILANVTSYWHIIPFALFYGIAFGGTMATRAAVISTYFGTRNFGALEGLTQSATVVFGMLAPVLMGWIFDVTESYVIALYVLMAVAVAGIPLALAAKPPRPEPAAAS